MHRPTEGLGSVKAQGMGLRSASAAIVVCLLVFAIAGWAQDPAPSPFERVFKTSTHLDAETVEKVKQLPAGEGLTVDTDNDGVPDEQWYIDTARRHTVRPTLVRVVDEDGDLATDGRGDLDSDLYFWDWHADGTVDCVADYQDNDGDNDVDEMGLFYGFGKQDGKGPVTVWWSVDVGDDNLLWYDVNGTYHQGRCQYRTHFSGDEVFYQFRLSDGADTWVNQWEDPFAFYDRDGDTCSEEVVRISAVGGQIANLRYSMDADDDAYGRCTHDYDFSITAVAPEGGLRPSSDCVAEQDIRGLRTLPVLTWETARPYGIEAAWGKALLTWDEVNSNTEANAARDPNERWEGIINAPSKSGSFPGVGGPATSRLNKRVEVAPAPQAPLRLYFDKADRRLHLVGANEGYLDVDIDLDGAADAAYVYADTDGDGVFDRRLFDADADGQTDCEWPMVGKGKVFALEFAEVSPFYRASLRETLEESRLFVDVACAMLDELPPTAAKALHFWQTGLGDYLPARQAGRHIQESLAGARYYLDVIRDDVFVALQRSHGARDGWPKVEEAYAGGAYKDAARHLAKMAGVPRPDVASPRPLTLDGHTFHKRVPVRVKNDSALHHDAFPVVLRLADIRGVAPDFNAANCAAVMGDCWVDWVEVPHQVDAFFGEEELVFQASARPKEAQTFYLYYAAEGERQPTFDRLTGAVLDHPTYVAWESDAGAFRFYTGQFDFFGKRQDRLLPRPDRLIYPLVNVAYHQEQDWGIDPLHVGRTSGLGGLTMYIGETPHLVQSPAGEGHVEFEHRVLGAGPVRAAVEIVATNVLPQAPDSPVIFQCVAYAGHQESEIRVRVPEGYEAVQLAPGLLHLPQETAFWDTAQGVLGTWGIQGDDTGFIGLGVIVPPERVEALVELAEERRVRCALEDGVLRYWIVGDWRRGRQFPVSPTYANWQRELTDLAETLHTPPRVALGDLEIATK